MASLWTTPDLDAVYKILAFPVGGLGAIGDLDISVKPVVSLYAHLMDIGDPRVESWPL